MAKIKKINWKSKKTWKNILCVTLACVTIVGALVGLSALFRKADENTKEINPTYVIGGLTEQGKYLETEESIYTKDAFECQGLDIELDFRSNISYRVFFYDKTNNFLSSTSKLVDNYDETTTPTMAQFARIVITPNEDDKISWYEKNGYADQLTITIGKVQKDTVVEENFDKYSLSSQNFTVTEKVYYSTSSFDYVGNDNFVSYEKTLDKNCLLYVDNVNLGFDQFILYIVNGNNVMKYTLADANLPSVDNPISVTSGSKVIVSLSAVGNPIENTIVCISK